MATETTKYPFLLQNDTNNFVLNNQTHTLNNGRQYKDYDFNYLFTSKLINPQKIIANENASERASLSAINLFDKSNENYEKEQEAAAVKKAKEEAKRTEEEAKRTEEEAKRTEEEALAAKKAEEGIIEEAPANKAEMLNLFKKALFDKEQSNIEKILKNDIFITSFQKDEDFKKQFKKVLDKYNPDNLDDLAYLKIFTNSIKNLPINIRRKYKRNDDISVIMSISSNDD